ncbi:MAG TPA: sigma-70 family RNA polymerase sigma factor [Gaiellaceae bacterium]|nr:sigma-70 family RNA polymerase sigma factor [Gaiellaceae bacterium]
MSPLLFKRLSDENLGSRLASGEAAAFDELYRRYAHRLAAYGSHLLGDAASGEDVAQAAMLKAYGALRAGRLPDKMKPWLFRIAHNAAIDLVARRRELSTETLPEQPAGEREPFAGALVEALATLPDRQRRVYLLREVHGLRIDETSAELGLTAAQVEQSLFAARNRLAEQLVFGDRLNCVTVQRLAEGSLDASERRALKTHLRSCHECRSTMGLRGRALTIFPSGAGLEWLRGLGAGLIGGGAPVAAKVGAVVATATIVGGGTVAVEKTARHHAPRATITLAPTTPAATPPARPASLAAEAVQVAAVTPAPVRKAHVAGGVDEHQTGAADGARSHEAVTKEHDAQQIAEHDGPSVSSDNASNGDGEHTTATAKQNESARSSSHEHSGKSAETHPTETHPTETQPTETHPTETQPTETHPTETQPAEPQDPEHTSTTSTTADLTPTLPVVTVPGN